MTVDAPDADPAPPEPFPIRDPEALRAISHPLRQRILFDLVAQGYARAADLAQRLGEPANSISFHLRVLARAGMITEAPEHARDRRDRVWRAVADTFAVDPTVTGLDGIVAETVDVVRENIRLAMANGHDPFPEDEPKRALNLSTAVLTRAEAVALVEEVNEVLLRWADTSRESARDEPDDPTRGIYRIVFALGPGAEGTGLDDDAPGEVVSRS